MLRISWMSVDLISFCGDNIRRLSSDGDIVRVFIMLTPVCDVRGWQEFRDFLEFRSNFIHEYLANSSLCLRAKNIFLIHRGDFYLFFKLDLTAFFVTSRANEGLLSTGELVKWARSILMFVGLVFWAIGRKTFCLKIKHKSLKREKIFSFELGKFALVHGAENLYDFCKLEWILNFIVNFKSFNIV